MAKLEIIFGGCTKKGLKDANEDAFCGYLPEDISEQCLKGAIACIADGISGSKNAQIASQLACETIVSDYFSTPEVWSVKKAISVSAHSLNDWFFSQTQSYQDRSADRFESGYITTFSCIVIKSNTAHIFHAGDTRIYQLRGTDLEQITLDHSHVQQGSVTYLEQALGLHEALGLDYLRVDVKPGDRFLLTTDGAHDNLSHRALATLCADPERELEEIATEIVQTALDQDASDNASALLVEASTLPALQLEEVYGGYSSLQIPPELKPGDRIDHFRVTERLAKNARSHIYLVLSEQDQVQYVLKAPSKEHSDDAEYMEGFALEQWLGSKVTSPYLAKACQRPDTSPYFYYLCEFIQGVTLRDWIKQKAPVSLTEAQAMLRAMIQSVRVLHRNNIVHRDLKPANFIFDRNGTLKLIDFGTADIGSLKDGLAVPTQQNPPGDIGYLAPEYLVKGYGSPGSDLFSLAAIVYELLSGELPYAAILNNQDTPPRQFDIWRYRSVFAASKHSAYLPYWVDNVLKKALAPDPENRYQTLSEFEAELKNPSAESLRLDRQIPLIQRNPLRFYQGLSAILFLLLVVMLLLPYLG